MDEGALSKLKPKSIALGLLKLLAIPSAQADDNMMQDLKNSTVGAAFPYAKRRDNKDMQKGKSAWEKTSSSLRSFYHKLEKHHKIAAGLLLSKKLAMLKENLEKIAKEERENIEEIDLKIARNKKMRGRLILDAAIMAGTASAIMAICALIFNPQTIQLAVSPFIGLGLFVYSKYRETKKENAWLERKKNFVAEHAGQKRKELVERAAEDIAKSSREIKKNLEESSPHARKRFLKIIAKKHAGEIMQLLQEQEAEKAEQNALIFFSKDGSEFIPLRNIYAEFLRQHLWLAQEQINSGEHAGAFSTLKELFLLRIEVLKATKEMTEKELEKLIEDTQNLLNAVAERLVRSSSKNEKRQTLEELMNLVSKEIVEPSKESTLLPSSIEIMGSAARADSQILSASEVLDKIMALNKIPYQENAPIKIFSKPTMLEAEIKLAYIMQPLVKRIYECSLHLHTHPPPAPQSLEQAKKQMGGDLIYAKNSNMAGLMAAPIEGGFALYFYNSETVEHVGDFYAQ